MGLNRRVRYGNGCCPHAYRRQISQGIDPWTVEHLSLTFIDLLSSPFAFRLRLTKCSVRTSSLRKEVIQPHLPIRLPCYDFTPVIGPTFGSSSLAVRSLTSGVADSHGVTGGVYKTRERIHRGILIRDY